MMTIRPTSLFVLLLTMGATAYAQTNTFPSSGSVGIGTTSPGATLEVNGTALIDSTATFAVGGYALFHTTKDGGATGGIVAEAGKGLYLAANNSLSTGMFINANGHVGVGPTSLTGVLTVAGLSYPQASGFVLEGATWLSQYFISADTNGNNRNWGFFPNYSAYGNFEIRSSSAANGDPNSAGASRLAIDKSGNVGIGTTTPQSKLNVSSSTAANGETLVTLEPSSNPGASTRVAWSRSDGWTPAAIGEQYSSVSNYGGVLAFYTHADDSTVGNQGSPAERMRILASGNVGIGTTNPTQKLSVNGTIQAKEVIVQTGWSDFVFKPGYKLASLSEVEGAIKRDGHLPGIPSAHEVAEHGVSMGDMQSKLLAKVEELTLHLIAQEKRMDAQSMEISSLKTENARLRGDIHALRPGHP